MQITPKIAALAFGTYALTAGTAGYGTYKLVQRENDNPDHPVRGSLLGMAGFGLGTAAASAGVVALGIETPGRMAATCALSGLTLAGLGGFLGSGAQATFDGIRQHVCPAS